MILSDRTIKEKINNGEMVLSPLTDKSIQPASVDIRLGDSFRAPRCSTVGSVNFDTKVDYFDLAEEPDGSFIIPSHSFVLATTMEYMRLPDNIAAFVEGRSSIGRMGLFIENAGWIDPGFEGEITLELYNASPNDIKVKPGHRVGQLVFCEMTTPADNPYQGKYQGQTGATESRKYMDEENK